MSVIAILLSAAASSTAVVANDVCGAAGAEAHSPSGPAASHGTVSSCRERCSPHGVDEPWGPIEDEALVKVSLLHMGTSLKLGLKRGGGSGGSGSGTEDAPRIARAPGAASAPAVSFGTPNVAELSLTAADLPIGHPHGNVPGVVPNSSVQFSPIPPRQPGPIRIWHILWTANRYRRWSRRDTEHEHTGPLEFFKSATFIDWAFFVLALAFFLGVYVALMHWPSTRRFHGTALFIWLGLAIAYNFVIWRSLGPSKGRGWFVGYLLEFVFSIENVFIYHRVSSIFGLPRVCAQKALFIVVVCQVLFQMLFFMGLAQKLQSMVILPYVVGVWLLYVAYHSLDEEDKTISQTDLTEDPPAIMKCFKSLLGKRFIATYRGRSVLVVQDGNLCITALAPATLALVVVCFVMEIDVTLTKIQEIPNNFVAFTSSMAAAFAVPELFFVARDLFSHFRFLKYGVAFTLVFFSLQLLLHEFLEVPELVGMLLIVIMIAVCMLLSRLVQEPEPDLYKQPRPGSADDSPEEEEEARAIASTHGSALMASRPSGRSAHAPRPRAHTL